jgi:hypothetical protein
MLIHPNDLFSFLVVAGPGGVESSGDGSGWLLSTLLVKLARLSFRQWRWIISTFLHRFSFSLIFLQLGIFIVEQNPVPML